MINAIKALNESLSNVQAMQIVSYLELERDRIVRNLEGTSYEAGQLHYNQGMLRILRDLRSTFGNLDKKSKFLTKEDD